MFCYSASIFSPSCCLFIAQYTSVKCEHVSSSFVADSVIPRSVAHRVPLSLEFSRQDARVGSHSLLQGILLTQGLKSGLLPCRQTCLQPPSLSQPPGNPSISKVLFIYGYKTDYELLYPHYNSVHSHISSFPKGIMRYLRKCFVHLYIESLYSLSQPAFLVKLGKFVNFCLFLLQIFTPSI